jgi:hypothetical protein
MPTPSLATLIIEETKEALYNTALAVANTIGVNTTSWQAGDPTRSLYHYESEVLSSLESSVVGFIKSDFLSLAEGMWLKLTALEKYGVTVPDATFATTTETLTNNGGGVYDFEANDLTFRNSRTGKTYHNTSGGHLPGWSGSGDKPTLTLDIEADEAGSESNAAAGEITELVTTKLGVTCTNPTVAIGIDEQDEEVTREQCRAKLSSFSPNGPRDVYKYVARNIELTGASLVPRVRVFPSSDTGDVIVYVTGPSGTISEADRALIEAAIVRRATPLTITPSVLAAAPIVVNVTFEAWVYKSVNKTVTEVDEAFAAALADMFEAEEIGGDFIDPATPGKLYQTRIHGAIFNALPQAFRVVISAPGDVTLANDEVATLGTITSTIHFVDDP